MDKELILQEEACLDNLNGQSVKFEEKFALDCDPSLMKTEQGIWDSKYHINLLNGLTAKSEDSKYVDTCTEASTKTESNKHVISENDIEQLMQERNSMIKIAYDVCCMYMDIEKDCDSDRESADSGISEQGYEKNEQKKPPEEAEAPTRRTTRSQSKAESQQKLIEESKSIISHNTETMEAFLLLNSNFLSKAVLESVKGTEVGDLLNQLEIQKEENTRLEKYVLELERRRDALKLNSVTTQNLIFQRCQAAQDQRSATSDA